ncbi:threonine/homoserine/homoserine lactone efflux protein [Naumannella cuiyingiana]|uniref:Threonine/homoserine/homoserine lactone efflux protein n=1 Tax=Naumannella cuiyingiana TaxID=1347891 RepID=A0A7Z0DBF8_9ACTN|nr:LysE family translocator [Naumannella cuiyingiana]NYI72208.1 threonine/homoserine/homoserine lactone efflux protein [Naumannella cuiyingiana]
MITETLLPYLAVVLAVVLVPGADFTIVLRNTVIGGRGRGLATSAGVAAASMLQGLAAAAGLGALIMASHTLFAAVKWLGVVYLCWLAAQALISARRGRYRDPAASAAPSRWAGFRQGFLGNATNPKILIFYLALLPQFLTPGAPIWIGIAYAWLLPVIGTTWLVLIVFAAVRARALLLRSPVRRAVDALTGVVLGAFALRLATERS